jgi:hypothetical protein
MKYHIPLIKSSAEKNLIHRDHSYRRFTMNKKSVFLAIFISLGLPLAFFVGLSMAQEPLPDSENPNQAPVIPDARSNYIPIQGRLTDSDGLPLHGYHNLTFRLYNELSGGTPLCSDTNNVFVDNGLFSTYIYAIGCSIDGRRLYLGVEVESDGEMTPRQRIGNVPTAWSLRPGAIISDTLNTSAILHIENWGTSGRGLRSYAMDDSSTNYAIVGASRSPTGYGGYFYNNGGGIGLHAWTNAASGVGVIAEGFDSGPDLILGSNANTTVGDDGIISSDPDLVSSDIILKSNDTVRIDLDNDGSLEDADFEIYNESDDLIFNVDNSGAVIMGGAGIAAFPRPAYDSGWDAVIAGGSEVKTHGLGGNIDNYVVDLTCQGGTPGVNNWGVGGDANWEEYYGGWWSNLTDTQITIHRWSDDTDCGQMRVRIWMYP